MATPHTLLELYSQLRIQLPTLPLFTFQRPDTAHCGLRIDDCGLKNQGPTPHASQSEIGNPKPAPGLPTFAPTGRRRMACQPKPEGRRLVEPKGFEPMTSWLQTRRSPN